MKKRALKRRYGRAKAGSGKIKAIVAVRSAVVASRVPWALDVLCPGEEERRGELTTDRAESSQGLPVVVVAGIAYGPADLGPHELSVYGSPSDREAARAAGYTVHVEEALRFMPLTVESTT